MGNVDFNIDWGADVPTQPEKYWSGIEFIEDVLEEQEDNTPVPPKDMNYNISVQYNDDDLAEEYEAKGIEEKFTVVFAGDKTGLYFEDNGDLIAIAIGEQHLILSYCDYEMLLVALKLKEQATPSFKDMQVYTKEKVFDGRF